MFFIHRLFMIAACIVTLPCSAVFYQYTSMVNPQTGHHVHLFSDCHIGTPDITLKQVDDLSKFVKNVRGSKEVIVEDLASKITAQEKNSDFKMQSFSPLDWSELSYSMQNISVHNVEFRYTGEESWSQASCEAMQYDDPHPMIKDYYARIKRNFNQVRYDPSNETAELNQVCDMLDMRIIHRIRYNEQQGINTSIVLAGGYHTDGVKDVLGKAGYQVQLERGISQLWEEYWSLACKLYASLEGAALYVANKIALDIPSATQQT